MQKKKLTIKDFIDSCSLVFKTYQYDVNLSKNRTTLWHFSARKSEKKYMIYCAPQYAKTKGIVKIALKKIPKGSRLVVVCSRYGATEKMEADTMGYSLIDYNTLEKYGLEMIDAKARLTEAA
ncbi:hypothetical protein M899_2144 [Bacteriovorax sp. BSW11_IV]|uniref:hypothetical protein n=1 Tax=Bacteriovorax sp. BSW11_IV TaxID=1353529 RepID=UPI000389E55A|nr:hypothetical protein [Bacteriovorax sp. BSW11_IV]EQC47853.1 hypothetical protein M899_2144 [Bacteriovorax sp. BSW11_IV]